MVTSYFSQKADWVKLIMGASSQQHTCLSLHSIQSVSQVFVKLLAELTLATPGLLSSSTASATEFLASVSFVEACATERCFIRSELLTMNVDKGDLSSVCTSTLKTLTVPPDSQLLQLTSASLCVRGCCVHVWLVWTEHCHWLAL